MNGASKAVVFLVLAFLFAGCFHNPATPPPVPAPAPAPAPAPSSAAPTFLILAPEDSQVFQTDNSVADITVSISTSNLIIRPITSTNKEGEGHFLFQLDNEEKVRVFSKDYVLRNVEAGEHALTIELVNNDNTPYAPPIKKTVRFIVEKFLLQAVSHTVEMGELVYAPAELTIRTGDSVTWTNTGRSPRTATSPGNFNSGVLASEHSFTYTFTEPGTYEYFSTTYPAMKGTIVVQE